MGAFDDLPTLAEVQAARAGKPIEIGPSRLQVRMAEARDERRLNHTFRAAVWTRDRSRCRCCGRLVSRRLARVPERGEVHHLHSRIGARRRDVRTAVLVCLACHERVTGKVDERWAITGTAWFEEDGQPWIDATYPVECKRIA